MDGELDESQGANLHLGDCATLPRRLGPNLWSSVRLKFQMAMSAPSPRDHAHLTDPSPRNGRSRSLDLSANLPKHGQDEFLLAADVACTTELPALFAFYRPRRGDAREPVQLRRALVSYSPVSFRECRFASADKENMPSARSCSTCPAKRG